VQCQNHQKGTNPDANSGYDILGGCQLDLLFHCEISFFQTALFANSLRSQRSTCKKRASFLRQVDFFEKHMFSYALDYLLEGWSAATTDIAN
jgi:hypothetical protein